MLVLTFYLGGGGDVSTIFGFTGISLMFPVIMRQPCFQELTKYLLNIQSIRTAEVVPFQFHVAVSFPFLKARFNHFWFHWHLLNVPSHHASALFPGVNKIFVEYSKYTHCWSWEMSLRKLAEAVVLSGPWRNHAWFSLIDDSLPHDNY